MRWLLASAVLLAIGMIVTGAIAGRTLHARDAAVREGLLTRAAHELERDLRERGPDEAAAVLQQFVAASAGVGAVELRSHERVILSAGAARAGAPLEMPLFLGPSWREMAGAPHMAPRQPPFRLRIWPARGAGDSSAVAALATWGSVVAALALLAFAAGAAHGITARERTASLEEERRRLELVSAAGAGLAHRIRNPLATAKATAQLLASHDDATVRERASRIVTASVRIESLIDDLLRFARPVEVHAEELDLGEAVQEVVRTPREGDPVRVRADREHVVSAIEELVANARAAGTGEPEVVVSRQGTRGVVEVRDRGPGLQIDRERAFEPYVTTRAAGTGLGLAIVRALMRANGGEVSLRDREGGGCVATITLPAVSR
jgi:signal transduction histidine kinase